MRIKELGNGLLAASLEITYRGVTYTVEDVGGFTFDLSELEIHRVTDRENR